MPAADGSCTTGSASSRALPWALLLLAAFLMGGSCRGVVQVIQVAVLGDSHSDVDREPPHDWIAFAPGHWLINEQAVAGQKCWQIIPNALATPAASFLGNVVVIYCGTNDAGRDDWDLGVTLGWIQAGVDHAVSKGQGVVVVAPPPVFREYPVSAELRNQHLADLRDGILALRDEHPIAVADLWDMVWSHEDPPSLYADGLHLGFQGRQMSFHEIYQAVYRLF